MPRITGRRGVQIRLQRITSQETVLKVGAALFAGGDAIRAEAFIMIKDGFGTGKNHIPSVPGEAPHKEYGTLRTNLETTQPAPLRVEVSSNAPYAAALEFGTSKMLPRPYMQPATDRKRKEVVELVQQAVSKAVKG